MPTTSLHCSVSHDYPIQEDFAGNRSMEFFYASRVPQLDRLLLDACTLVDADINEVPLSDGEEVIQISKLVDYLNDEKMKQISSTLNQKIIDEDFENDLFNILHALNRTNPIDYRPKTKALELCALAIDKIVKESSNQDAHLALTSLLSGQFFSSSRLGFMIRLHRDTCDRTISEKWIKELAEKAGDPTRRDVHETYGNQ